LSFLLCRFCHWTLIPDYSIGDPDFSAEMYGYWFKSFININRNKEVDLTYPYKLYTLIYKYYEIIRS